MMKIIVITDAHANRPALQAVLDDAARTGYDLLFHTGDTIAIGPQPRECLELLLSIPNVRFTMGNHDALFVRGLPSPLPPWFGKGEAEHQRWTHSRLTQALKKQVALWPLEIDEEFERVKVSFVHYALNEAGDRFLDFVTNPGGSFLDKAFARFQGRLIFYGHEHSPSDVQTSRRYVNPGSLGCTPKAVARYCVVEFRDGKYTIDYRAVPYNDRELYELFKREPVPEKLFINRVFFGGRFNLE